MDSLSKNISALEREMQISQISPIKIIGGSCLVVIVLTVLYIFWSKPSALMENDDTMSWPKLGQFVIAIGIALLSILWILWNLFMY